MNSNTSNVVQVIIATGLLTAISATVQWVLNRGKTRVDGAKVVQGMALDLLTPLRDELERVNAKVVVLSSNLDDLLAWAVMSRAILDAHTLPYPPVPHVMSTRPGGAEHGV